MTTIGRASSASSTPSIHVFDGTGGREQAMTPEQVTADSIATTAAKNEQRVLTYLHDHFGRNGIDNKGAGMDLVVHAPEPDQFGMLARGRDYRRLDGMRDGYDGDDAGSYGDPYASKTDTPMNNAYWDMERHRMYVGDGDGTEFTPLGGAVDILAHESGHAVLASEVDLDFDGQQGALHESFGDVLGCLVDDRNWQIGESALTPGVSGDAVRDLSQPQQFHNVDEIGGETEPHLLADIPNFAAYDVARAVGREDMGKIWYDAFTDKLQAHADFGGAAEATLAAAKELFGAASKQTTAVSQAWQSVGVLDADDQPRQIPTSSGDDTGQWISGGGWNGEWARQAR